MTLPLDRAGADRQTAGRSGRLPPGQSVARGWPVLHYGPVPRFRPDTWELTVSGATAAGADRVWSWEEFGRLPRTEVVADFHCVTRFSLLDCTWEGVSTAALMELAPPAREATHVLVWAEYGYTANLALSDLQRAEPVLATHCDGEPLTPEHGFPLRLVVPHRYGWKGPKWVRGLEYLTADRRGFWEERGYHNTADPWREQRYGYQEDPGEGPPAP